MTEVKKEKCEYGYVCPKYDMFLGTTYSKQCEKCLYPANSECRPILMKIIIKDKE